MGPSTGETGAQLGNLLNQTFQQCREAVGSEQQARSLLAQRLVEASSAILVGRPIEDACRNFGNFNQAQDGNPKAAWARPEPQGISSSVAQQGPGATQGQGQHAQARETQKERAM